MTPFLQIAPQTKVDELSRAVLVLDEHLGSPSSSGRGGIQRYLRDVEGKQFLLVTKYFRNKATLHKLEAFVEALDPFFIAVEYFQGTITISRIAPPLTKAFTDKLAISLAIDSLRSSMDIFAKSLAWYFSLPGKEELGFSYKSLVRPLRNICEPVANKCNEILQSSQFNIVKALRDADKHIGQGKHTISFDDSPKRFSISIKGPDRLDIPEIQDSCAALFESLCQLMHLSVVELQKWPLGYDAPDDKMLEETPTGNLRAASQ